MKKQKLDAFDWAGFICAIVIVVVIGWAIFEKVADDNANFTKRCEAKWGECCGAYAQGIYEATPEYNWEILPMAFIFIFGVILGVTISVFIPYESKKKQKSKK